MAELNRREFVIAAACAAGACLMCGMAAEAADAPADAAGGGVDVGTAADYPKDGVYDNLAKTKKVIVVRENGKIFAMTANCSHGRGGIVVLDDTVLTCPKHHSKFTDEGKPTAGPAKAALFRHAISTNADGHILVDTSKKFGENQWDDAAASISVK
jgi:nitrite reductase/ring-hydroxylating ferredoxin subunit